MSEFEIAQHVLQCVQQSACAAPPAALAMLKPLTRFIRGDGGVHPLELDEARSTAFLAICDYAKALHRGQPAGQLWAVAVAATDQWRALAKRSGCVAQLALGAAG
ncbi:MAG TPA: hypothetical protein VGC77_17855 [Rhodopseudomonas sp.]|uniref:hypothetical protein n=1 Tax=Rhodopseudomonas sp. TaxID=1078 RepID=UPI002ED99E72